jgi:hypothetical protein
MDELKRDARRKEDETTHEKRGEERRKSCREGEQRKTLCLEKAPSIKCTVLWTLPISTPSAQTAPHCKKEMKRKKKKKQLVHFHILSGGAFFFFNVFHLLPQILSRTRASSFR